MFKSSSIAPQDKVPFFQKLMFSIGVNADYVATALLTGVLWMPFFNIGLGMSPAVLGLVLMAYRAWDAITDPVVGNWSDIWLFLPSMKGDVADWDELHTHRRREGSINSFYSWFIKASLTCAMGVGGFVLQFSGFDAAREVQPDHVLSSMFNLFLYLPLEIWGIAWISAWLFPLNRARALEIRAALEVRRGVI